MGTTPALRRSLSTTVLVVGLVIGVAPAARAQLVTNPRKVEFQPSADHDVLLGDGRAAVSHYLLEVYQAGAATPFHTVAMGKPAPDADGFIRYDFSGGLAAWPLPGGTYQSRVAAVGPYGTGRSEPSNPFAFSAGGSPAAPANLRFVP